MSTILEQISVVVDGYQIKGFQSVSISRSMQDGAMSFELKANASTWSPQAMALRNGKQLQIYSSASLGSGLGDLILTGTVDEYDSETTSGGREVSLSGRSKGRDAIDCHPVKHKTGLIKNKTLHAAATEMDEFGTNWTTDQALQPIPVFQRRPEETLFQTVERYARRSGHMLVGQPDGGIMITRAGTKRHAGALVLGQSPVIKMGVKITTTHKKSPVVVRGQRRSGTGATNLRQEYMDQGDDGDDYRPALIIAEGDHSDDDLKTRAKWERLRMAGYGIRPRTTVAQWRDQGGMLWTPGYLIAIENDDEGVYGDFTLSSVTLSQQDGEGEGAGTRAQLEFVDPAAHGGKSSGNSKSDSVYSSGDSL